MIDLIGGALLAALLAALLTPIAIRVAHATGLLDRPGGWKRQARATPQLGGVAVLVACTISATLLGGGDSRLIAILAGAILLCAVGIVDDFRALRPPPRLLAEACAGGLLWASDLGWNLTVPWWVNLLLTVLWVIGIVNSFNLIDLMDGLATSVAAVALGTVGALALANHDPAVAALAFALAGAALGFLPYNTSSPARIFLGDGGSMSIGFACAALILAVLRSQPEGVSTVIVAPLLFGVPLLDMGFRIALRLSTGVTLITAGPDSLANRLGELVTTPRAIAGVAAATQLIVGGIAIAALGMTPIRAALTVATVLAVGLCAAARLQLGSRRAVLHEPETHRYEPDLHRSGADAAFIEARSSV